MDTVDGLPSKSIDFLKSLKRAKDAEAKYSGSAEGINEWALFEGYHGPKEWNDERRRCMDILIERGLARRTGKHFSGQYWSGWTIWGEMCPYYAITEEGVQWLKRNGMA